MKKFLIIIILICPLLLFAGKRRYVVLEKGMTLWRISKNYKVPVWKLKKINKIRDTSKLKTGKKIYLSYPHNTIEKPVKLNIKLNKPVNGIILNNFNEGKNLIQCNGIEYQTEKGAKIRSALSGTVKFTGMLRGYGKVVIIQYSNNISTIYAYLNKIIVAQGQKVDKNQAIGFAGKSNFADTYALHFELLRNGKPINPKWYF
ncbi:MAG: LysM peptidoglycan-binding domain-containing M23 family metallopeptidase [Spirochaetes bacterium]|nr:LysM peptidoglycan-binding domain-containing M23 family metallopeptidase [Spirochaetota bacterium]